MAMRTLGTFGVRTAWYEEIHIIKFSLCIRRPDVLINQQFEKNMMQKSYSARHAAN
jgi:hypothetical protein